MDFGPWAVKSARGTLISSPGLPLVDGRRPATGRAAQGEERERLWARWAEIDKDLDALAARRSTETAVVVFEPRTE